ncbi:MAG: hypothetical protein ACI4RC_03580 [Oscillospiraceae bacterium]
MPKDKKQEPSDDELLVFFNPTSSMNDCTGLIPRGDNLTDDEYEDYQELYTFGPYL